MVLAMGLPTDLLATARIGRVTVPDIESLIVRLPAKGLADSSIHQIFSVLRQVLDTAVRDGLIRDNPAAALRRPSATASKIRSLSPRKGLAAAL